MLTCRPLNFSFSVVAYKDLIRVLGQVLACTTGARIDKSSMVYLAKVDDTFLAPLEQKKKALGMICTPGRRPFLLRRRSSTKRKYSGSPLPTPMS
jgi:hypothetical protein